MCLLRPSKPSPAVIAWEEAKRANTIASYEQFLEDFGSNNQNLAREANLRIKILLPIEVRPEKTGEDKYKIHLTNTISPRIDSIAGKEGLILGRFVKQEGGHSFEVELKDQEKHFIILIDPW